MPLKTFRVSGTVLVPVGYDMEIEASSVDDAEVRARDFLLKSKSFKVRDFNGDRVEIHEDDIEVEEISDLKQHPLDI